MFSGYMHLYCTISVFIASVAATRRAVDDPEQPDAKVPALTQTTSEDELDSFEIWEGFHSWSEIEATEPIPTTTTVAPTPEPVVNEAIVITKSLMDIPFTRLAEIHANVIREVPGTTFTEQETRNEILRLMSGAIAPVWFHELLRGYPAELDYRSYQLIDLLVMAAPSDIPKFKCHEFVRYLARHWIKYCISATAITGDSSPCKMRQLAPENPMRVMVLSPQMLIAYLQERLGLEEYHERRRRQHEQQSL